MLIPHNSSAEEALRLTGVARLPFSSAAAGLKPKKRGLGGEPRPYGCVGNGSASPRTGGRRGRAAPAAGKADEPPPFSRPAPCREGARARPPPPPDGEAEPTASRSPPGAVRKAKRSRTAVGRHVGLYGSGGGAPPPSALEPLRGGNGGSARLRTRGSGEISLPPPPPPRGE